MEDCHRQTDELSSSSNATVVWKIRRRLVLSCSYCKPHRVENCDNWPRHGRNDRYKDRRISRGARIRSIRDPHFWETWPPVHLTPEQESQIGPERITIVKGNYWPHDHEQ